MERITLLRRQFGEDFPPDDILGGMPAKPKRFTGGRVGFDDAQISTREPIPRPRSNDSNNSR